MEFSEDTESTHELKELKAPKNFQASRPGLVAQAYQVFLGGLPSGVLGYHLLLSGCCLLPSVLKVSCSRTPAGP
jgi:hypothetical protein